MRLVLDASVAIKLYIAEADSSLALRALATDADFIVPHMFFAEVGQALLRHHRERRLSVLQLDFALADLTRKVSAPASDAALVRPAISIARLLTHRLHDCFYLALAEHAGCEFLTADEVLVEKVRRSRLPVSVRVLAQADP
jgi:predicted nucleic acid-binding protein